jgi:hypothetical protein
VVFPSLCPELPAAQPLSARPAAARAPTAIMVRLLIIFDPLLRTTTGRREQQ